MTSKRTALATPVRVGHLTLKHRIIMGPMGNWLWHPDGKPKPEAIETVVARVQGGAAMVMVGAGQPHPAYENGWKPGFWQDENIASLRVLTDAVHAAGAPIVAQLQHDGPSARPPVSPSGIPCVTISSGGQLVASRAHATDEVAEMAQQFMAASRRAQQAGFDGVELAGQAGYLLGQFLSPRLNQRGDRYGGDAVRRQQLALDIVRGVRAACGPRFVIGYALSVDELQPGGMTPEECVPIAQALQAAGLDYLDVRVGTHETFAFSERAVGHNRYQKRGGIFEHTAMFKRAISIPVFASTHGAYEPAQWEAALQAGAADVIQVGKAWLAEPRLAEHALAANDDAIRPCTLCMYCLDMGYVRGPSGTRSYCAVNHELGREGAQALRPAATPRRVLVIGSGPAGLECARVAAARGHRVTVWEREAEPGGCLRQIARGPGGDRFGRLADWLVQDGRTAGVQFECGREATTATLLAAAADIVVNATGAAWHGGDAGLLNEVGGTAAGVQLALMLGERGRRGLTIYEADAAALLRGISRLESNFVQSVLLPKYQIRVLTDGAQPAGSGAVIDARPQARDHAAFDALTARGTRVHVIGDARQQRSVGDALHDGARQAREL
jgi:2,4-dienoyl-CoA reductase (NADPH2)